LVNIYYDLLDLQHDKNYTIFLSISVDGGKSYNILSQGLTGDIGEKIAPGEGKHIIWNTGVVFDSLFCTDLRFRLAVMNTDSITLQSKTGLFYIDRNSRGYEEYKNDKDGSILIKIPAGEFRMGTPAGEGEIDEHPQHKVYLNEYYIGKYEVTNEQFEQFINATGYATDAEKKGRGILIEGDKWVEKEGVNWRYYNSTEREKHPVVLVSWNDTQAYCVWARLQLPTEAEWEKAARGMDGREYPWGNDWNAAKCISKETDTDFIISKKGYVDMGESKSTLPVGSYSNGTSVYGCYDLAGNAWEWCNDWYGGYYTSGLYQNPKGPLLGDHRVLRGGSFYSVSWTCRSAFRIWSEPSFQRPLYGFRVSLSK